MAKIVAALLFIFSLKVAFGASFIPRSFDASIEQVEKTLRGKDRVHPARARYKFKGQIYFEVKGKNPITYVCNRKNVWVYNPPFDPSAKGEVKIGNSSKYCLSKFFDVLSNGLKNNGYYSVSKTSNVATLRLNKKTVNDLSVSKIEIKFKNKITSTSTLSDVDYMSIHKVGQKNPFLLRFKGIKNNVSFDSSLFTFTIPANTNKTFMK